MARPNHLPRKADTPKNPRHRRAVAAGLQMEALQTRAFEAARVKSAADKARRLIDRDGAGGSDKGLSAELYGGGSKIGHD